MLQNIANKSTVAKEKHMEPLYNHISTFVPIMEMYLYLF